MPYSHSSVDEQVVKMSFDNSNFDSNINDSIKALNSLDTKLGSLNKQNFEGLTNSINNLATNFTVKGQIMFGVLARLGSEIVSISKRAIGKLTQGVRDGLGEYNQIIDATQTIYQNVKQSGASIDDVNYALDELNDYADLTIYNFGQMTRMIGMFTSAGVGLKKATSTIKGLANAAALVGASPERAQIAWNAVSRAMSSGVFTNITWKSLELSNIAGKQFNKVITEVARANKVVGTSGKNIDQMIKKYGTLRETLREKWLTKDLFNEAMEIMSGGLSEADLQKKGYTKKQIQELTEIARAATEAATQVKTFKQLMETTGEAIGSGWAQSFRILIGDLEVAKKLYTRISTVISNFIDNNAKIRNELFKQVIEGSNNGWRTGRDDLRQIIENMLTIIKTFIKSVQTGFLNIFPIERISEAARKVLDVVQKFTKALVINKEEINKDGFIGWDADNIYAISDAIKDLIRFFRGLASAVDIAWMAISQPIKAIVKRIPFLNNFFKNTNESLINITKELGKFGDKITVLRNAIKSVNLFGAAIDYLLDNIEELGKEYPVLGSILRVFKALKKAASDLKLSFKELQIKPLSALFGAFKMIVTAVWKVINALFNLLKSAKDKIDWSWLDGPKRKILNALKVLSDYGQGLITFEQATEKISEKLGKIFAKIRDVLTKIGDTFTKSNFANALAKADGLINESSNKVNASIDKTGEKISAVWAKVKSFFGPIGDFFSNIITSSDWTLEGIAKKIGLIGAGIGAATLGVSHLVKTLKKIKIIDNINDLLAAGVNALQAYQREAQSKMILNIAISIGILAAAMATLAFIPYDRLENGLVIFTAFMSVVTMTITPVIEAVARLNRSLGYTKPLNAFIKEIGNFGRAISVGLNSRMIGKAFKDVAIAMAIFVASLIALKFAFKKPEEVTLPLSIITTFIKELAGAVGTLVIVLELFSKFGSKTKTSVDVFATFFKMAGVAKVIIAIAAAVFILANAMAIVAGIKSRKLLQSWAAIMSILALLGGIAMGVASIATHATDFSSLKRVTVSLAAAVLGVSLVIAAMALLIKEVNTGDDTSYLKAIAVFTAIITQFSGMTIALISVARLVGDNLVLWTKLEQYVLISSASLAVIAGAIYLLGKAAPIDESIIQTLGILAGVILSYISLLSLISIVIAASKRIGAGEFAAVISGISLSIASFIASIGVMAAGIGFLINSLNALDISESDTKKASTNLIEKLTRIAKVINKALPKLKKLFYNLGVSAGSLVASFINGFAESMLEMGEAYSNIAEKFVDLIINIFGKVVLIFYKRKDDLTVIVRALVDIVSSILSKLADELTNNKEVIRGAINKFMKFVSAVITEVVNSFFHNRGGVGMFTEDQIMRFIGVSAIAIGAAKIFSFVTKGLSSIGVNVKNLGKLLATLKGSGAKVLTALSNGFERVGLDLDTSVKPSFLECASAIMAIAVAISAVDSTFHAFKQHSGEEAQYIRTDIDSIGDAIKALFTDANFRTQVLTYGWDMLGQKLVTSFMTWINLIKGTIGLKMIKILNPVTAILTFILKGFAELDKILGGTGEKFEKFSKQINTFTKNINNFTTDSFKKAYEDFDFVVNSWEPYGYADNFYIADAKQSGFAVGEGIITGEIEGYDSKKAELEKDIKAFDKRLQSGMDDDWERHSPSKVTIRLWRDIMEGSLVGLKKGSKAFNAKLKEINDQEKALMASGALDSVEAWNQILAAYGISGPTTSIRDLSTNAYDANTGMTRTVELNKEYLELIEQEKEALEGKTRVEALSYLRTKLEQQGVTVNYEKLQDLANVVDAAALRSANHSIIAVEAIEQLVKDTSYSLEDAVGVETAATDLVIKDINQRYTQVMHLAEDHKNELVGKKKEEVQEFLKQEAIKSGMTESEAEETSRLVAAQLFAGMETQEAITKDELTNKINAYKSELTSFESMEHGKTAIAEQEAALREAIAQNEYTKKKEAYDTGKISESDYRTYINSQQAYADQQKLRKAKKDLEEQIELYDKAQSGQRKDIEKLFTDAGTSADDYAKLWNDKYNDALNTLNTKNSSSKDFKGSVLSQLKKLLGLGAGDVDTSYWNQPSGKNGGGIKDTDKAISAAKDLKEGLEAQRADLTPTFDLDKLASDANKANGIVMSSLMAAQNASIGDYINKDSELNPFMKDRWQNVYNFTQNNYSPKALSRIDIYRQTQRQISMSRGF